MKPSAVFIYCLDKRETSLPLLYLPTPVLNINFLAVIAVMHRAREFYAGDGFSAGNLDNVSNSLLG